MQLPPLCRTHVTEDGDLSRADTKYQGRQGRFAVPDILLIDAEEL